jgi:DNA-directed RNA polymerase specialized sigma24 family protein
MPYEQMPTVPTDVADLHTQEADTLVAFLGASDRSAGLQQAEQAAEQAFLDVAATWPGSGGFGSTRAYLFAAALRTAAAHQQQRISGYRDALAEAGTGAWTPVGMDRLTALQDNLDALPAMARRVVLLREMCGFSSTHTAEITGLTETAVDSARGDALRLLGLALGSDDVPLAPEDFFALRQTLGRADGDRRAARQALAGRLARPQPSAPPAGSLSFTPAATSPSPLDAPAAFGGSFGGRTPDAPAGNRPAFSAPPADRQPFAPPPPSGSAPSWGAAESSWAPAPAAPGPLPSDPLDGWADRWAGSTALDVPLSALDLSGDVGTPLFDAVSAWFSTGTGDGEGGNPWAALDDDGWQDAAARAAADPEVAGVGENGLPQRRPGANMVPSAGDVDRRAAGGAAPIDAGQVRQRLGRFLEGVTNARRQHRPASGAAPQNPFADDDPVWTFGSAPTLSGDSSPARPGPDPYDTFHREQLPHLLALLLLEGATPARAAEIARDVMADARHRWAGLDTPHEWIRDRALDELEQGAGAEGR